MDDLFWRKVVKTSAPIQPHVSTPCWLWTGCLVDGYGQMKRGGVLFAAHRASWVSKFGAIPNGLCVLHCCDVRRCVNPEHLFLGTNADNTKDKMSKGRHRAPRGAAHYRARLTEAQVVEIRSAVDSGRSQRAVAEAFGIGKTQVGRIVHRERWAYLSPPV